MFEAKKQSGFTLIEVAIIILILGLVVGAIFSFMTVGRANIEEQITVQRQKKIAAALSYYAQIHNSLPCPSSVKFATADLVGDPSNCQSAGDHASHTGVVPFRVLGLSQKDATDGFGNAFTYAVSIRAASPATNSYEAHCRVPAWNPSGTNLNPNKAAFCCQADSYDLVVNSPPSSSPYAGIGIAKSGTDFTSSANTQSTGGGPVYQYFAYILVSHGRNGFGAFHFCQDTNAASCTATRSATANATSEEVQNASNASNDGQYFDIMRNSDVAHSYDDIVFWRSQDQVLSELGNDSCAVP